MDHHEPRHDAHPLALTVTCPSCCEPPGAPCIAPRLRAVADEHGEPADSIWRTHTRRLVAAARVYRRQAARAPTRKGITP